MVTMGAADTVMVSSVGEYAVSGVNVVDSINYFLVMVLIALSTGGAVVVSQYIGRQDYAKASLASKQLVYIVFIVSVILTILALVFRAPILNVLYGRLDEEVMKAALIYFLITALSYPMMGLYNACAALYRSAGNSKAPMMVSLVTNILHVGLNALFIFVFRMGVPGVAVSTLLTRAAAGAALYVKLLFDRRISISLTGMLDFKFIPSMVRRILNIGIPGGLENSMFQMGRLLTQRIFPYFGTSIIAANAVAGVVNSLAFQTGNAFCVVIMIVAGQCIGAGDKEAAKRYTTKLVKVTWIVVSFICINSIVFRNSLVSFFSLSPEAMKAASSFLLIHSISMLTAWTFSFAYPSALRAAGDAKYIMIVGTVSMWTIRVCGAYLLSFTLGLGPVGVWIAMGLDFLNRGILFFLRWRGGKWEKLKVISD